MNKLEFVRRLKLTSDPERNYKIIKKLPCKKYQGVGRIVIYLNDKWVLKVAKNKEGLNQNCQEYDIWGKSNSRERKHLCAIRYYCPNYSWIIQRKVEKKVRRHTVRAEILAEDILLKNKVLNRYSDGHDLGQLGYVNGKLKIYDYGI